MLIRKSKDNTTLKRVYMRQIIMAMVITEQAATEIVQKPLSLDKYRRLSETKQSELIPTHVTQAQLGKLEDKFNQRKWPDDFTIQMIALECNMLERHVANWYEARRLKWKRDMIKLSN